MMVTMHDINLHEDLIVVFLFTLILSLSVVIKEVYNRDVYIWCRICDHEDRHRNPTRHMIQVTYDGYSQRWCYSYLWRHYVCY
ncbi:hypothetical protein ACHAXS_000918 [Conticribra weissflogii]